MRCQGIWFLTATNYISFCDVYNHKREKNKISWSVQSTSREITWYRDTSDDNVCRHGAKLLRNSPRNMTEGLRSKSD